MTGRCGLLVCENIVREVRKAVEKAGYSDVVVESYASFSHRCRNQRIENKDIAPYVGVFSDGFDRVYLVTCGCMPGLSDDETDGYPFDLLPGGNYGPELFLPTDIIDMYLKNGAYIVLPCYVKRWQKYLSCQGFDQKTARDFFSGAVKKIVLIDTGVNTGADDDVREFAGYLGLPYEIIRAGISHLSLHISELLLKWRVEEEKDRCMKILTESNRKIADYSMSFELIDRFSVIMPEEKVVENIFDLFSMLFSPGQSTYAVFDQGSLQRVVSRQKPDTPAGSFLVKAENYNAEYQLLESEKGFLLPFRYNNQVYGVLRLEDLAFPEYINSYIDIAVIISHICALAIFNARTFRNLEKTVIEREEEIQRRLSAEKAAREANKKLNLLNSITRHDILNQLMVLLGYIEMSLEDVSDPGQLEILGKEKIAAQTIQRQITFTRDYQDVGVKAPVWSSVGTIISKAREAFSFGPVALEDSTGDLMVFADPLFEKVIYTLIDNSLRYGKKLTQIRFSRVKSSGGVKIICEDDGVGVPADVKQKIFNRGYFQHTGFGLYLSREIVSITGFSIEETGEPGTGARFEIHIPEGAFRFSSEDTGSTPPEK